MTEEQTQDTPKVEEAVVPAPAPEVSAAPAAAPVEEKQERLVESDLEASHSEVLPLSPIAAASAGDVGAVVNDAEKKQGRRGLRRGNSGRGRRDGKNAAQSVGVVENPGEAKETLSGKFVDGYEKNKEGVRSRDLREKPDHPVKDTASGAQGWCLKESSEGARRRHPQSNTNTNRAKLIIEPAPIPEQEKDPSFWQKFKNKILAIFGLNKKKKKQDKKRRGGKYRNKHGKPFQGGKNPQGDRNGNRDFRGNNRRHRHKRGHRSGNSGDRPQNKD